MGRVKEEVKRIIDELSEEMVEDLKPFLERMIEWEATVEGLRDKDLLDQIHQSEQDLREGATVPWRSVERTDV